MRAQRFALGLALLGSAFSLSACNLDVSLRAEAKDQWKRHYMIAKGGTLEIRNTNGLIRIEPGDGVDVTADRIVQAGTDQAAKDALSGFEIQESASPDHVLIDSAGRKGLNLSVNLSRRVEYHVRAPEWMNVRLATTNGDIHVEPKLTGKFQAEATNGRITAQGLEGSADASTTNGTITLDVAKISDGGISAETTNGAITLSVPPAANAHLSARVTNGAIRPEGLNLTVTDSGRRRLEATLGAGGPAVTLETTNGAITIRAR